MKLLAVRKLLAVQCAALLTLSAGQAHAIDAEWTGAPIGAWYIPPGLVQFELPPVPNPNWDFNPGSVMIGDVTFGRINYPNNVPGFDFDVTVENAILGVAPPVPMRVSSITFGGVLGAGLNVEAGGSWGIISGTVNGGTINVNALGIDSVFTDLTVDGTTSYMGGGTITLGDSVGSRITGGNATSFSNILELADYTLEGGGTVGNESMSLRVLADGVVRANATTPMVIDPGPSGNIVNSGLMEAVDGGTLRLQNTAIVNTGGILNAGIDSQVLLQEVKLTGGALTGLGEVRAVATVTLENSISNSGRYIVSDGTVTFLDGDLNNSGIVQIEGGSFLFNTDTSLIGGGAYLLNPGGGTSFLGGAPTVTNVDNTIRGGGNIAISTFINQSDVIADRPVDPLRILSSTVVNQATMSAEGAELNIRSGAFDNNAGTLEATGGTISATNGAQITGGQINIDGASTLLLDNGSILGGAVTTNSAGGTIATGFLGGMIDGTLNNPVGGTIRIADDSELIFFGTGTYNNAGRIVFDGSGAFASFANTSLQADGDVTVTGGGTIDLGTSGDGILNGRGGTVSSFTNLNNTITGSGAIRLINSFNNQALIDVNNAPTGVLGSGILFLVPGAGGLFNTGVIQASNGGTLDLGAGTYNNAGGTIQALTGSTINIRPGAALLGGTVRTAGTGTVEVGGVNVLFDGVGMELDAQVNVQTLGRLRLRGDITNRQTISILGAGQLLVDGTVTVTGGGTIDLSDTTSRIFGFGGGEPDLLDNVDNTITGTGEIRVAIRSGGTTAPGNSPGTLTVLSYIQTNAGTLQIELAGDQDGEFDVLNVLGAAELAGTLEVVLLPGLDITTGTTFDVVTAQSLSANFDTLALPTGDLAQPLLSLEQFGNTLRLTALADISVPIPEPSGGLMLCLMAVSVVRRRRCA